MNEINTKTNALNIKIKNKNQISFKCTSTIYFLILNFELILFFILFVIKFNYIIKIFLLSRALHGHNTSIYIKLESRWVF